MALLLHLSDLHLTGEMNPTAVADRKADVVPITVTGTRAKLLRSSLGNLDERLRERREKIDAIVISGDVANQGNPDGFKELTSVLAALGDSLPERGRILIVPGNHDVDRKAVGGARFAGMKLLRGEGYLVGWLAPEEIAIEPAPLLRAEDGSYVVVGLNSSIFAGSTTMTEATLAPHLSSLEARAGLDAAVRELLAAWRKRGEADIARMSDDELAMMHILLGSANGDGTGPLRIATLHHQLLPVNTNEEMKPFESVTNLGHLRRWLASNSVDLVLHGHKHSEFVMRDRIDTGANEGPHDLTIMSAPSIVDVTAGDQAFGQLINVPPTSPRHGNYEVTLLQSAEAGTVRRLEDMPTRRRPLREQADHGVLAGESVDAVYAKIRAVGSRVSELPAPLVCRIDDGTSAHDLPRDMADVPVDLVARAAWLSTVLDWWQSPIPGKAAPFNHGQYLYPKVRNDSSAIDRIVSELLKKRESSRALALLVNQETMHDEEEFPSFISLQFVVKNERLDAIAYFRKQELLHWWPINVAEIAKIQREVADQMEGSLKGCGSITTVTAMPILGSEMPAVAVPELDRRVDRPGGLLDLVLPLFSPTLDAKTAASLWQQHFDDWVPQSDERTASHARPKVGLYELSKTIRAASDLYGTTDEIEHLIEILDALHDVNEGYHAKSHAAWASSARIRRDRALKALQKALAGRETTWQRN